VEAPPESGFHAPILTKAGPASPKSITLHVKKTCVSAAARPVHAPKLGEMRGALECQVTRTLSNPPLAATGLFIARTSDWSMARAAAHPHTENGGYALPQAQSFFS